jgi:hypothetical protein
MCGVPGAIPSDGIWHAITRFRPSRPVCGGHGARRNSTPYRSTSLVEAHGNIGAPQIPRFSTIRFSGDPSTRTNNVFGQELRVDRQEHPFSKSSPREKPSPLQYERSARSGFHGITKILNFFAAPRFSQIHQKTEIRFPFPLVS